MVMVGCKCDLRAEFAGLDPREAAGRRDRGYGIVSREAALEVARTIGAVSYMEVSCRRSPLGALNVLRECALAALHFWGELGLGEQKGGKGAAVDAAGCAAM